MVRLSTMSALKILVYSDDSSIRQNLINALGKRLAPELPENEILEFATGPALRQYLDTKGKVDLFILDGEAAPEGGMGIAKQLKDEVFNCGVVVVLVGRASDAWLAGWSRAEGVVSHPLDPFTLASTVADIFRKSRITA